MLVGPVVGLCQDTGSTQTIPSGAWIELSSAVDAGSVSILWNGVGFQLFRNDLLNACSVEDVGRVGLARNS